VSWKDVLKLDRDVALGDDPKVDEIYVVTQDTISGEKWRSIRKGEQVKANLLRGRVGVNPSNQDQIQIYNIYDTLEISNYGRVKIDGQMLEPKMYDKTRHDDVYYSGQTDYGQIAATNITVIQTYFKWNRPGSAKDYKKKTSKKYKTGYKVPYLLTKEKAIELGIKWDKEFSIKIPDPVAVKERREKERRDRMKEHDDGPVDDTPANPFANPRVKRGD
jgi:hypothetical protein